MYLIQNLEPDPLLRSKVETRYAARLLVNRCFLIDVPLLLAKDLAGLVLCVCLVSHVLILLDLPFLWVDLHQLILHNTLSHS